MTEVVEISDKNIARAVMNTTNCPDVQVLRDLREKSVKKSIPEPKNQISIL